MTNGSRIAEPLGRFVFGYVSPTKSIHPHFSVKLGFAIILGLIGLFLGGPRWFLICSAAAFIYVDLRFHKGLLKQNKAIENELPVLLDILIVSARSGRTILQMLEDSIPFVELELRVFLERTRSLVQSGMSMEEALRQVSEEQPILERLFQLLVDALQLGAPLVPGLISLRDQLSLEQLQSWQAQARKAPILMLFPLVLCTLPAFVLLTIVPLFVSNLSQVSQLFV